MDHDYPTEVPCSPIMPVRCNILGKWYCAMPGVSPCTAPTQLQSGLNRTEEGDFARGLGKSIFTKSQMERHHQYWRAATSWCAVVAKATNSAAGYGSQDGSLGLLVNGLELDQIAGYLQAALFPNRPALG